MTYQNPRSSGGSAGVCRRLNEEAQVSNDQMNGFLLKILSGLQFGVEVALSEGAYSFGSGAEADIQFADVSLQPVHGRVRIRGGKLDIKSEGGDISTSSGLTITSGSTEWNEIAQLDIIEAGTTRFAVAGRSAKWSSLASANTTPLASDKARSASVSSRWTRMAVGVLSVALVAFLSAGGFYFAGRDLRMLGTTKTEERKPLEVVRLAIKDVPFMHHVTVTEAVDGTIEVQGYVKESVERRAINNALDESGVPVNRRIWVHNAIELEVADLIRSQGVGIEFVLSNVGELTLTGTLLDPEQAERVVSLIRDEVFGLSSVVDEVRTADDYLARANGLLEETRLEDRVILRLDGLLIEATGVVTIDRIDSWVGFVQAYAARYADILPLRAFVTLESQTGEVGEPIVIGASGAVTGRGRSITPEALAAGAGQSALELFAVPQQQPSRSTANSVEPDLVDATTAPDDQSQNPDIVLNSLLAQFVNTQPDLFAELKSQVGAGKVPSFGIVQEAAFAMNATLSLRDLGDGPQAFVLFPGLEEQVSVADITRAISVYRSPEQSAAPVEEVVPDTRVGFESFDTSNGDTQTLIESVMGTLSDQPFDQPVLPYSVPSPGRTLMAVLPSEVNTLDTAVQTGSTSETRIGDKEYDGVADEMPEVFSNLASSAQSTAQETLIASDSELPSIVEGFESFSGGFGMNNALSRLIAATAGLWRFEDPVTREKANKFLLASMDGGETALDLARLQGESLAQGQTLLRMPRPLSALPILQDRPTTCWPGSRIRVEALPSVLLLLDLLSLDANLDLETFEPDLKPILMEGALSPDRIEQCLELIDTAYSNRLNEVSAFLAESRRNSKFSEFIFRNVEPFAFALSGVNLANDRYMQAPDGSKIREGGAPDIASRVASIGDRGALLRVEEGWQVWLYPDSLLWLVAEEANRR